MAHQSSLLFPCLDPVYGDMQSEGNRLATLTAGPYIQTRAQVRQFAEAGFFFMGTCDQYKCFYCGGGFQEWERGDDPWVEHAKWYPNCEFLLQKVGLERVAEINRSFPRENQQQRSHDIYSPTAATLHENFFLSTSHLSQRAEYQSMDPTLHIPPNIVTLPCPPRLPRPPRSPIPPQLGLNPNTQIIENHTAEVAVGSGYVYKHGHSLNFSRVRNVSATLLGNGYAIRSRSTSGRVNQEINNLKNQLVTMGYAETLVRTAIRRSRPPVDANTVIDEIQRITQESERFLQGNQTAEPCVVCLENHREIRLMPCRHLAACQNCVKHLTRCPIADCRNYIENVERI